MRSVFSAFQRLEKVRLKARERETRKGGADRLDERRGGGGGDSRLTDQ